MKVLIQGFNHTAAMREVAMRVMNHLDDDIEVVWMARERDHEDLRASGYRGEIVDQEALVLPDHNATSHPTWWTFDDADYITLLHLLDREGFDRSYHSVDLALQVARRSADGLIDRLGIERVVMDDVPHALGTFVLYLAAKARGIPVHFFRNGPARHQRFVSTDIHQTLISIVESDESAAAPLPDTEAYVRRLSGSYAAAEPKYMRTKRRRSGVVVSALRTLRRQPSRLLSRKAFDSLRARRRRQRLLEQYESIARPTLPDGPFVCLFLHLQPERTSVPMGGRFAQQLLAAEAIANRLPDDWRLVVREHPSTFMPGPKLVRTMQFYRSMRSLPSTDLLSLDVNPFEIIDRSAAVATLTGTVGLEAVVRGVPVLTFGNAAYLGCPGVIDMRAVEDLDDELRTVIEKAEASPDGVLDFLAMFDSSPAAMYVDPDLSIENPDQRWRAEYEEALIRILHDSITSRPAESSA